MTHTLESTDLQLVVKPERSFWSVFGRQRNSPFIEDARLGVAYRVGRRRHHGLENFSGPIAPTATMETPVGPGESLSLHAGPDLHGLHATATFALPRGSPLLLWRITVDNQGDRPVAIDRLDLLRVGYPERTRPTLPGGGILTGRLHDFVRYQGAVRPHPDPGELAFFSNGWQSWSPTGVYGPGDRFRRSRLGPVRAPMFHHPGAPVPRKPGHFLADMFAVLGDRTHRTGMLAGFLSQTRHFGSIEVWTDALRPSLRVWAHGDGARLDPGAQITTDWACLHFLHLDVPEPLRPYLDAVARLHGVGDPPEPVTGWCSWYHFYEDLTPADVRRNLEAVQALRPDLPLDLVQIDDGYQARAGDWLSFDADFPNGVAPLAERIRAAGCTPGLWLAPFLLKRGARLAARHRDWILRNRWRVGVNAGFYNNAMATALDLTHPGARQHVQEVVGTLVHDWGFPYLKLDFLYAGALPGRRHDPTMTRAQALRAGLEAIRSAAGERAFLLGCGCPLGSAIGLVDAMRINPDVSPRWGPSYRDRPLPLRAEADLPATRNAVHNALTRAPLHRRWWLNDPDCLVLRPEAHLSLAEMRTLATVIALTGGATLISDDLPHLPPERLRILEAILPPLHGAAHVLDWFDQPTPARLQMDLEGPAGPWHLVALFNWEDRPADLRLRLQDFYLQPGTTYLARDFWGQRSLAIRGAETTLAAVPAHGVVVLALRRLPARGPQYVGSDLHISQGREVVGWRTGSRSVELQLGRPGRARGEVEVHLPGPLVSASIDGQPLAGEAVTANRYRLALAFERQAHLKLEWTE